VVSFTRLSLYPWERAPGTLWTEGWVDPRAGMEDAEKIKFLTLTELDPDPSIIQPVESLYRLHYPGHFTNITTYFCTVSLWVRILAQISSIQNIQHALSICFQYIQCQMSGHKDSSVTANESRCNCTSPRLPFSANGIYMFAPTLS
jgi:hypothetical protein